MEHRLILLAATANLPAHLEYLGLVGVAVALMVAEVTLLVEQVDLVVVVAMRPAHLA